MHMSYIWQKKYRLDKEMNMIRLNGITSDPTQLFSSAIHTYEIDLKPKAANGNYWA